MKTAFDGLGYVLIIVGLCAMAFALVAGFMGHHDDIAGGFGLVSAVLGGGIVGRDN